MLRDGSPSALARDRIIMMDAAENDQAAPINADTRHVGDPRNIADGDCSPSRP